MNEGANSRPDPSSLKILILCTGNSVRSQMVEAWFHRLAGSRVEAFSAGIRAAKRVHPMAIQAMAQVGVDMSGARVKSVDEFLGQAFDYVITVCAPAAEACPVFPGKATRLHWPLDDPAEAAGDDTARLQAFGRIRDQAAERVRSFLGELARPD